MTAKNNPLKKLLMLHYADSPQFIQQSKLFPHCGLTLLFFLAWSSGVLAHGAAVNGAGEYMLFTQVDAVAYVGDNKDLVEDETEVEPALDLFMSKQFSNMEVLGEVVLSEEEQEIERLQFGWNLGPANKAWLGRFHNPIGFWNTQFHHGANLQVGIQRPWITEFEDDGGVLATHITGGLLEGEKPTSNDGAVRYALALGYGPELTNEIELEPVEYFIVGRGEHKIGFTINAAYLPDSLGSDLVGAFLSFAEIPIEMSGYDPVGQAVIGLYTNWSFNETNIVGALFWVDNEIEQDEVNVDGNFVSHYLQVNYSLPANWIIYGRFEKVNSGDDPYLDLIGAYIEERRLAGVRYDLFTNHSFQLEYSEDDVDSLTFEKFIFQWNAVFSN